MKATTKQHNWSNFLQFYFEQNEGRLTRIGVFENGEDFWLEAGMPLVGIDVDTHSEMPTVEIMVGDNFTHTVKNAKHLNIHFTYAGDEDGLDITDAENKTTVLRFEK